MIHWNLQTYRSEQFFVSLLYWATWFHVAMHLFSNRSRNTSKCGEKLGKALAYRLIYHLFCSFHILKLYVIYYWTDAHQHGIYLLNRLNHSFVYWKDYWKEKEKEIKKLIQITTHLSSTGPLNSTFFFPVRQLRISDK